MKKIFICILLLCITGFYSTAFAYEYTEQEKNQLYNNILKTYLSNMEAGINQMTPSLEDRAAFMQIVRKNANRAELEKTTWYCVKQISPQDKEGLKKCIQPWMKQQTDSFKMEVAIIGLKRVQEFQEQLKKDTIEQERLYAERKRQIEQARKQIAEDLEKEKRSKYYNRNSF